MRTHRGQHGASANPEQSQDLPGPYSGKGEAAGLWENVVFPSPGLPPAVGWDGSELRGLGKWGGGEANNAVPLVWSGATANYAALAALHI